MGKTKKAIATNSKNISEDFLFVDPARVRFQHSKIRPTFSGCGRPVVQTLDDIREGKLKPEDLPPIQVLIGPIDEDGKPWYFSLNNRRLWVLKRCREEGLLENNQIPVRVRRPKSAGEIERYTVQNCALEAKFIGSTQFARTGGSDGYGSKPKLTYYQSSNNEFLQGDIDSDDTKNVKNESVSD
jgi:hypothetical protein